MLTKYNDKIKYKILEGYNQITCIDISLDDTKIISADLDNKVIIWNAMTHNIKNIFNDHERKVNKVKISHDSKKGLSVSNDCTMIIRDIINGIKLYKFIEPFQNPIISLDTSKKSLIAIYGCMSNIKLCDIQENKVLDIYNLKIMIIILGNFNKFK